MIFGYTIVYVPDVAASLTFFETAFGFARRFFHESGAYGELDTGATTLAFASHAMGAMHFRRVTSLPMRRRSRSGSKSRS